MALDLIISDALCIIMLAAADSCWYSTALWVRERMGSAWPVAPSENWGPDALAGWFAGVAFWFGMVGVLTDRDIWDTSATDALAHR
jgi:hypothetical protein